MLGQCLMGQVATQYVYYLYPFDTQFSLTWQTFYQQTKDLQGVVCQSINLVWILAIHLSEDLQPHLSVVHLKGLDVSVNNFNLFHMYMWSNFITSSNGSLQGFLVFNSPVFSSKYRADDIISKFDFKHWSILLNSSESS